MTSFWMLTSEPGGASSCDGADSTSTDRNRTATAAQRNGDGIRYPLWLWHPPRVGNRPERCANAHFPRCILHLHSKRSQRENLRKKEISGSRDYLAARGSFVVRSDDRFRCRRELFCEIVKTFV